MPGFPPPFRPHEPPGRDLRASACRRGYDRKWRTLRRWVMAHEPWCRDPFGQHQRRGERVLAEHVDHVVPLAAGGMNDESNLQPLCQACHNRKTANEKHLA